MHTKLFSMGSILSSPVVQDGTVYFGSVDGKLYALGN
jgi:outer membrane protein assembly factor BamB